MVSKRPKVVIWLLGQAHGALAYRGAIVIGSRFQTLFHAPQSVDVREISVTSPLDVREMSVTLGLDHPLG